MRGGETRVVGSRLSFGSPFWTGVMDRLLKSQLSARGCGPEVLIIEIPGRDALRCVRMLVDTARVNLQKLRNITLKLAANLQAAISFTDVEHPLQRRKRRYGLLPQ